ncbi:hypothetical protein [Kitasatospora cineracea]|uniref:hypothetical protein n=1 Tax=Kitasatospora cineracea TaxID=88074 RepID=UPI0037AC96BB
MDDKTTVRPTAYNDDELLNAEAMLLMGSVHAPGDDICAAFRHVSKLSFSNDGCDPQTGESSAHLTQQRNLGGGGLRRIGRLNLALIVSRPARGDARGQAILSTNHLSLRAEHLGLRGHDVRAGLALGCDQLGEGPTMTAITYPTTPVMPITAVTTGPSSPGPSRPWVFQLSINTAMLRQARSVQNPTEKMIKLIRAIRGPRRRSRS